MIQYYINNRPVPRAIARHHLIDAMPYSEIAVIKQLIEKAAAGNVYAINRIAEFGIHIAKI
jgi:hypothetical protein